MPLTYPNTNTCSEKPPTDQNAIAPASSHTTSADGADQDGHPGRVKGEGAARGPS